MIQSSICRRRLRIVLSGTALLLAGICLFPAVSGSADKYWTGGTGVWENNGNWDPAGAPQNADSVFITSFDGIGRTVTYSVLPASPTILNLLRVDAVNGGTSSLAQTAAPFSSHTEVVGYQGTGAFNQTGGTNETSYLYLGYSSGSIGTYTLSGSGTPYLHVLFDEHIGGNDTLGPSALPGGYGTFLQGTGRNIVDRTMYVGRRGNGSYNLSGDGFVSARTEILGYLGSGAFIQSGASQNNASGLTVGWMGAGRYELNGGELNSGSESIGYFGNALYPATGAFIQRGGTNTLTSILYVGGSEYSPGRYELVNGDLRAQSQVVGFDGEGRFLQTGGTNAAANGITIGSSGASVGRYDLEAGSLTTGTLIVGWQGTGTFVQSGGMNTASGLLIASESGSHGTYDLKGGDLFVGNLTNRGSFNYSGGNLTLTGRSPAFNNFGVVTLSGQVTRSLNGRVTNNVGGTFNIVGTTAEFSGSFRNDGAYVSESSTSIFPNGLDIGATGYLSGGAHDSWVIGKDFMVYSNYSDMKGTWSTGASSLGFVTGTGGIHNFLVQGVDLGTSRAGYANNFSWGTLSIAEGNKLVLMDMDEILGDALYVGQILGVIPLQDSNGLWSVTNITGNGVNIYYDPGLNKDLGGLTYALAGGGYLIAAAPVPIPGSLILFGSGLLGLIGIGRMRRRM